MFDIGWTEILILATISLFVIGPKEIPKFLGYVGKMIAKIKGISRELQDSVDDAIKNSELEDIRKEISTDWKFKKDKIINKLELVSREEFEVLKKIVQKQDLIIKKLSKSKKIRKAKKS